MKKLLLTAMLMLLGMATWAQNWTAPGNQDYTGSTPVYVQVNVNGVEQLKTQVAAFIDGDCRAVSYSAEAIVGNNQYHQLRVWGDPTADYNKNITFKVAWNGLVFTFKKSVKFTGETHMEIPVVLNVDMPTGVTLTNPLNIEAKLPYTHDLMNDITFTYDGYTPLGESAIETELYYEWDFANSASYFTVENNKLLATATTMGAYLGLTISAGDGWMFSTFTDVIISEPVVPVTSISCTPTTWDITINDNLYELEALNRAITVLPEDATNKGYTFEPADAAAAAVFQNGMFTDGGTYNINIVSSADENIKTTIVFNVTVPVDNISINHVTNRFFAIPGENIFDLISPYVEIGPYNATNKNFSFVVPEEASDAIVEGVAEQPGIFNLIIKADADPSIGTEAEVVINKINAPESITLNIGEPYGRKLYDQIQVLPIVEAETFTYTIAPKTDADAEGFDGNGGAIKAGTYTLLVTCDQNPKATAEIQVRVLTPVTLTFPASLTLSKLADTQLQITFVEGDNFDPSLVEIAFIGNQDEETIKPITYTAVSGGQNLKWNVRGNLCGRYTMSVAYNGTPMLNTNSEPESEVLVPIEIPFNNAGWDWIYYPAGYELIGDQGYLAWLNQDTNNRIIDLRSQNDLLYNDANFGLFGTIERLSAGEGMYKIKAAYADPTQAVFVGSVDGDIYWQNYSSKVITKGYNWIGYPNEWDMTIDDFNTIVSDNQAQDGDMIIGKTGFAEFDGMERKWIAQDGFTFQAGKGYIYYSGSDEEKDISFEFVPAAEEVSNAKARVARRTFSVWQYDAGAFADNMAIVAEINGLQNPEHYTIGAFVDGECRGEGSFVSGNKMMISVAGKSGEQVSFRLYNTQTGNYSEISETLRYSQKVGSLKQPVALTSPETTGIKENYEFGTMNYDNAQIFDMNGRRVETMSKSGVYVIKTIDGGKTITRKVVKK